jgi:hypothetical protein
LTKYTEEKDVCLDCSGIIDDLSYNDEDFQYDLWTIKHPGGKTQVEFLDEYQDADSDGE